jgi:glycosyltransferase involved in cell wall biosynthesis
VGYDLLQVRRTSEDAALLVPSGGVDAFTEAIIRLAHDPDLRDRLAREARARAVGLTWERSGRLLSAAYTTLRDT